MLDSYAPLRRLVAALAVPLFGLTFATPVFGGLEPTDVTLADLLPAGGEYDPAIPPPAAVLGFEVGAWHPRPELLASYYEKLAAASDRVELEETGRSHERRAQLLLTISSPANLARLPQILAAHRALSEGQGEAPKVDGMPVVVWLGYSIHGNEPSGASAALAVAYHLAASRSAEVAGWLEHAVVMIDPALNPDGLGRFATWANMNRGTVPSADPNHREHVEDWPSGRGNHYWFDLNRDWLPITQPESAARVAVFQRMRPNVFTDFHEMGSDSTYFFQPGVPTRQNPLTPARNLELTQLIAAFHGAALDALGSAFYTEENFDDFYYGKGSTYPDVQGSVGILFEQASSRGHVQDTNNGRLTFPFTVRNQVTTSFSTLRAAVEKRRELLTYQRDFYRDALAEAGRATVSAQVVGDGGDPARLAAFAAVLRAHGIEARSLARNLEADGERFTSGQALVVPMRQRQYRLIRAIFDRPKEFADESFYDVSAWTLPLAFGLPTATLDTRGAETQGEPFPTTAPAGRVVAPPADQAPVAWAFEWHAEGAPRALGRLLAAGLRARVALRPLIAEVGSGRQAFRRGTVLVPAVVPADSGTGVTVPWKQPAEWTAERLQTLLATVARDEGVEIFPVLAGLTPEGIDLGSPNLPAVTARRPLIAIGRGVSGTEAGETWHTLDRRLGLATTLVDVRELARLDLSRFNPIVLPDGAYRDLPEALAGKLGAWVRAGGTLIAIKGGAGWAEKEILSSEKDPKDKKDKGDEEAPAKPYGDHEADAAHRQIAGALFWTRLDLTHPLAFGYARPDLASFRDHENLLTPSADPYAAPVRYTKEPLAAGFVSPENLKNLAGIQAVIATRMGSGTVVRFGDNPNFRGFFRGTERLFTNAVFLGGLIRNTELPKGVAAPP